LIRIFPQPTIQVLFLKNPNLRLATHVAFLPWP